MIKIAAYDVKKYDAGNQPYEDVYQRSVALLG